MSERVDRRWLAGYHAAISALPGRLSPIVLVVEQWDTAAMLAWAEAESPEVVITSSPEVWIEAMETRGTHIPRDLGIVSLNVPDSRDHQSGVCQNPARQAQTAIDLLIAKVTRNETGVSPIPVNTLIEGTWCPGKTVRPVGGR